MDVLSHLSYFVVADREDRESVRAGPLLLIDQRLDGVEAVEVEVGAKEAVHHEELSETVDEEEQFTDDVEHGEEVAVFLATEQITTTCQSPDAIAAALFVVAVMAEVSVDEADHITQVLLLVLDVVQIAAGLDQVVYPDAYLAVESLPDETRDVEECGLSEKDHGQPLVVVDPFSSVAFQRNSIVDRKIICV